MKQRINETDALNKSILLLQNKQEDELVLLKEQFHITYESLKPINIIKTTLSKVVESPELKSNIVNNVIGAATGYLSKIVLFGASRNPVTRLMGTLLQFAVTNITTKHGDTIKLAGEKIIQRFMKEKKEPKKEFHNNGYDLFL
ncbi:MAG: hypothetical protein IPJ66_11065 [Bacteroidetes bacterium]|nr:hypothetical protein [Bacteroidota bacterium]MBL0064958.1 hypothetical protein [Bacteroidota bacterium]